MASNLAGRVAVLTGGMPGSQELFAKNLLISMPLVHVLPYGQASAFRVGVGVEAGITEEIREVLLCLLGHVYITVEGGAAVARQAASAFDRGAFVVPLALTGGASSGLFGFPAGALQKPSYATEEQWACLMEKSPTSCLTVATAVVEMIQKVAEICMKLPLEDTDCKNQLADGCWYYDEAQATTFQYDEDDECWICQRYEQFVAGESWYFANTLLMDIENLWSCGLTPLETVRAELLDYRISKRDGSSFACVEETPGERIQGVVWLLSDDALTRLDDAESGHERVSATARMENGAEVACTVHKFKFKHCR